MTSFSDPKPQPEHAPEDLEKVTVVPPGATSNSQWFRRTFLFGARRPVMPDMTKRQREGLYKKKGRSYD